ncbi:MAG TPA: HepT-like ribonuclease domain-containing protein [Actinomycetota bacterium]|nr:HepT-like ribonuclease domain-containing protein [Actinomycetota bacterium]
MVDPRAVRNLLVHLYLQVDPERLWEALGHLEDLEGLAAAVEAYLGRAG